MYYIFIYSYYNCINKVTVINDKKNLRRMNGLVVVSIGRAGFFSSLSIFI